METYNKAHVTFVHNYSAYVCLEWRPITISTLRGNRPPPLCTVICPLALVFDRFDEQRTLLVAFVVVAYNYDILLYPRFLQDMNDLADEVTQG